MEPPHIRPAVERRLGLLRVYEARAAATATQRLRTLAKDPVRAVRLWTARNPNTPPDALATLLQDEDHSVQWNALLHPRTPPEALELLARQETEEAEAPRRPGLTVKREYVAHHPNTPPRLRDELIAAGVCRACPDHPCTTFRVFMRAANRSSSVQDG
jgi:hypothetical protein